MRLELLGWYVYLTVGVIYYALVFRESMEGEAKPIDIVVGISISAMFFPSVLLVESWRGMVRVKKREDKHV